MRYQVSPWILLLGYHGPQSPRSFLFLRQPQSIQGIITQAQARGGVERIYIGSWDVYLDWGTYASIKVILLAYDEGRVSGIFACDDNAV